MVNQKKTAALALLLIGGASMLHGAEQWIQAESPWQSQRASGEGVFGTETASEYFNRPADALLPWNHQERFDPHAIAPHLFGANRLFFRSGPEDESTGLIFGNEVGDPLWQELKERRKGANRTPTTEAFAYLPFNSGAAVWGELRQVDHWSSRFAPDRKRRLQPPGTQSETVRDFHSWFGENYTDYSSLGGGATFQNSHGSAAFQARSVWWWAPSPGSRRELPLLVDEIQGQFHYQQWGIQSRNYHAEIDDLSPRSGTSLDIHELLLYSREPEGEELWKTWLLFRQEEKNGDFPLTPEYAFRAIMGLDRSVSWNNRFRFAGSHWLGGAEWGVRDTLEVYQSFGRQRLSQRLFAELSNRKNPLNSYRESDESGTVIADLTKSSTWQHYGFSLGWSSSLGRFRWQLSSTPWMGRDLLYFDAESYKWKEKRWQRSGELRVAQGNIWGAQQRAVLSYSSCLCRGWELEYLNELALAGPWRLMEIEPAQHRAALRHFWKLPSGLDLRGTLLYTSGATIRSYSPEEFVEPDHFEMNLEIRQHLFGNRGEVWIALLNPLADDLTLSPNGADDRFRTIAGALWKF